VPGSASTRASAPYPALLPASPVRACGDQKPAAGGDDTMTLP
jgi:hypothetical protein